MNKNLSAPKIVYNKSVVLDPKCLTKSLALHLKHLNKIQKFWTKVLLCILHVDTTIVWTKVLHNKCLNKVLLCIPNPWTKFLLCIQNICTKSCFPPEIFLNKSLALHHKHLNKSLALHPQSLNKSVVFHPNFWIKALFHI